MPSTGALSSIEGNCCCGCCGAAGALGAACNAGGAEVPLEAGEESEGAPFSIFCCCCSGSIELSFFLSEEEEEPCFLIG